ncbi:thioesterase [Flagellimonas taeanensis]|jgi:acyl-CoA thioester hydrolase|uniref:Acyl-CoA thioester hydrolase n=1 Tax=Flagellimonas taeanensis TaxID=1005926 RepID=A0A1M6PUZ0_9FLAO|nr:MULTISPECIES: acyl-CoA thioesterase [Allomuricauda]MDC6385234.1 acyl-CoA thioesterase [Muricauda sp. SK9]MEE1961411.1 acyl-CoA thioesterase [Allomuricauda taeanensis]RIV52688.1 thioesterase [Allomuricauda taeanensis]SFB67997.1 acyl-CoA thioester hydrolase [Allomuricauda taeanensis]SHK11751.1 acyl-CoA thioester hydrolase [Allomuricauda taeanensis]
MFFKEFEIRWSDLDANRHMANSAYINFMSHTRMAYLGQLGFNQTSMAIHNIGPVVFYEHVYYFKEAFPGRPVKVSLEFVGMSEDGMFFEFRHNFYDIKGKNFARCEMMGAWIDLKERKLIGLPTEFLEAFQAMEQSKDFKTLTKEDTRKFVQVPKDLEG